MKSQTVETLLTLTRDAALANPVLGFAALVFATALFATWAARNL